VAAAILYVLAASVDIPFVPGVLLPRWRGRPAAGR